jgi:para-nitrobenzyl esterase
VFGKSEDALLLSIYTPATDRKERPVLFWIHGGAFQYGTGNGYTGEALVEQGDVVVVSVNYRLGVLGFLDLSKYGDEYAGAVSNGIRVQILALQWVRDNIADYGGDPNNVTIFGESAGASSVQSILAPPSDAAADIVKRLKLEDPSTLPEVMTNMPAAEIVVMQKSGAFVSGGLVDGVVMTRSLQEAIKERGEQGVPFIVGTNEDEGTLFTYITPRFFYKLTGLSLSAPTALGADPAKYLEELKQAYPYDSAVDHFDRVLTEGFRSNAVRTAEWAT